MTTMTRHLMATMSAAGFLFCAGAAIAADRPLNAAPAERASEQRDAKLEKRVEQRLETDDRLKGDVFSAQARGGHVTLIGTVANEAEKMHAERVASAVKGVQTVDNQIHLAIGDGTAASGQTSPSTGTSVERTERIQERREVQVRPLDRANVPTPGVDAVPGAPSPRSGASPTSTGATGATGNSAGMPDSVNPAPGPRPLPLPSEPASPGRRSVDSPGTQGLPSPTGPGDFGRPGDGTPGSTGASPGSPIR